MRAGLSRRKTIASTIAATLLPAFAGRSMAAAKQPPHIIVILPDDMPFEAPTLPFVMPQFTARKDFIQMGMHMEVALCGPSRASLFTGTWDLDHGVVSNIDSSVFNVNNTLASLLRSAGYQCRLFGKFINKFASRTVPKGWAEFRAFYSEPQYYNYHLVENGTVVSYGTAAADYSTDVVFAKAVSSIQTCNPAVPQLVWIAPFGPHLPALPPARYVHTIPFSTAASMHTPNFNTVASNAPAWQKALPAWNAHQMDVEKTNIWEATKAVDDGIASVLAALQSKGMLANSYVFFLTDNGISTGQHRWNYDKRTPYEENGFTPLYVRPPGGGSGSIKALLSNVDLYPTICELAGGLTPQIGPQRGFSFAPWLAGQTPAWRNSVLQRWVGGDPGAGYTGVKPIPPFWAAHGQFDTLIRYDNSSPMGVQGDEYYDLSGDFYELVNQINNPKYASRIAQLDADLTAFKKA